MGLVRLFHNGWPHLTTVGELVDTARAVPTGELMARMIHHFHEIETLQAIDDEASIVRQLIVVGVLISRALFELYRIEPRRSFPLGRPRCRGKGKAAAD
jgi:hypothetical protein